MYNISYFNSLIKDTWVDSPILLTVLLALTLTCFTLGVFAKYQENIAIFPIYFMILFLELIMFISIYSRMFLTSICISTIVFLLTGFEMLFLLKEKSPELCWMISPFLFYSFIQIAACDSIYKYNLDHSDILNYKNTIQHDV